MLSNVSVPDHDLEKNIKYPHGQSGAEGVCFVSRVHNSWWVPETQSTTPSTTDIPIGVFIYSLEALHLGNTIPLKYIEKNSK